MTETQKVVIAATTGAVAGALAGILFAPAKGEETREKISEKATDVKDNLTDIVDKGKTAITDLTNNGAEKVKEKFSKA